MSNLIKGFFSERCIADQPCDCCGESEHVMGSIKLKDVFHSLCIMCAQKHTMQLVEFLEHLSLEAQEKGFV